MTSLLLAAVVALSSSAGVKPVSFSTVASQGPWYLELGYQATRVSKVLGMQAAKKKWFTGSEEGQVELKGYLACLYEYPEGWVLVLFDPRGSAQFVGIHAAFSSRQKITWAEGNNPSFSLNRPIPKDTVQKLYGYKDLQKLPRFGDVNGLFEAGTVLAGEGNWGGSILYCEFFGRPGRYCNFILRQDLSGVLKGFGYFKDLNKAEFAWALNNMFFPPSEIRS